MLKKYLILVVVSLAAQLAIAQNRDAKRDYYWRSRFQLGQPITYNYWDYNYNPVKIDTANGRISNDQRLGYISELDGNSMLLSNGCVVANKNDSNIVVINRGDFHDDYCNSNAYGYLFLPGLVILPNPKDTNALNLFHVRSTFVFEDAVLTTQITKTFTGQFVTNYADSTLIRDTIEIGHTGVCRHANGRDWWIIQPKAKSNEYFKILFDGTSHRVSHQQLGRASERVENGGGQAAFSPDGRKYVRYNHKSDIRFFDFDRCSGQLSNPIHIPIQDLADTMLRTGCSFSPSSRYLYISSSRYIYQFDMQAANIAASKTTVIEYDYSTDTTAFTEDFNKCLLAPDGKIYVTANYNTSKYMHIIEAPDSAGVSCRAVQKRFLLPKYFMSSVPVFPNFRLGALRGSPCDTLSVSTKEVDTGGYALALFPNPATHQVNVDITLPYFDGQVCDIFISDVAGRRVYGRQLSAYSPIHNIDISNFPNGTYFVQLFVNGKKRATKPLVVLR